MTDPLVLAGRLIALLEAVAYEKRPCRFCQRGLYLVRVHDGANIAYTAEGINHMGDCPRFQPAKGSAQETLFPPSGTGAFEPSR